MTLILTAVTPHVILHLSDRLLTVGRGKPHDSMSNKTVVYRPTDGLFTIGYAGLAYQDNLPTDEWIAEQLWGEALPRDPDGRPTKQFGRSPVVRDIGQSVAVLHKAIQGLTDRNVDKYGLEVTIAGWQAAGRDRCRPVVIEIARREGTTQLDRSERRWMRDKNFRLYGSGADMVSGDIRAAFEPYRGAEKPPLTLETMEMVLAGLIRKEAAKASSTVGGHLMSVILPHPTQGGPVCRFLPMTPHIAAIGAPERRMEVPVAHTPWFVAPGALIPPAVEVGLSFLDLGGLEIEIQGAPATGGLVGLSGSVRRKAAAR